MASNVISGMCRCCASEGTFKDMTTAYHWMGEEEVYDIMLRECFDISLTQADCDASDRGICEVCITQLRNASNFKKQVLLTEEQFKLRLENKLFKDEIVKIEPSKDEEYDSDDQNDVELEVEFAEVDYTGVVKDEEPEAPRTRKRAAKASTSRAKRSKADGETSKRLERVKRGKEDDSTINKRKEQTNEAAEKVVDHRGSRYKHNHNIKVVLLTSNATVFRNHGDTGYSCCFCSSEYPLAADLKEHTLEMHSDYNLNNASFALCSLYDTRVYFDITNLICDLCDHAIESFEEMLIHLSKEHDIQIYTDIKNQIVPFKFETEGFRCYVCSAEHRNFKNLRQHMNSHCTNFVCDNCGAGFVSKNLLHSHQKTHVKGEFACRFCCKIFDTYKKKQSHERFSHLKPNSTGVYKCGKCNEKFQYFKYKEIHMSEVHGVDVSVKCQACDRVFVSQTKYMIHVRKYHLQEKKHECSECHMKYFKSSELKNHMSKHTGAKDFICKLCGKAYSARRALRAHERVKHKDVLVREKEIVHQNSSFEDSN